jgi:hypothetical protein
MSLYKQLQYASLRYMRAIKTPRYEREPIATLLFSHVVKYINLFMAIIPRHPGGLLLYSNQSAGCGLCMVFVWSMYVPCSHIELSMLVIWSLNVWLNVVPVGHH